LFDVHTKYFGMGNIIDASSIDEIIDSRVGLRTYFPFVHSTRAQIVLHIAELA
jgi:hypothetical protein